VITVLTCACVGLANVFGLDGSDILNVARDGNQIYDFTVRLFFLAHSRLYICATVSKLVTSFVSGIYFDAILFLSGLVT